MSYKETISRIGRLNKILNESYISYFIWKHLFLAHNKIEWEVSSEFKIDIINKYRYFFMQTENTNLQIFILWIAKLFDNNKNNKPISISRTRNYVQSNKERLTVEEFKKNNKNRPFIDELCENYKGITKDNIWEIDKILTENIEIIERFKILRDKRIAHEDKEEIKKIIPPFEKVERLFSNIIKIINIMSYWLENNTKLYSYIEHLVNEDMNNLFEKLT